MLNVVVQSASAVTEDIDVLMSVSSDECIDQDVTIDQQQGRAQGFLPAHQSAEVRASGLVSTDIMEIEDKPRMILALDTAASIPHDDNDQVMVPVDMNTFVSRFLARFAAKSTSSNFLPSGPFHGVSKSSHRAFTPIGTPYFKSYTPLQPALAPPENPPGRPVSPTSEEIAIVLGTFEGDVSCHLDSGPHCVFTLHADC